MYFLTATGSSPLARPARLDAHHRLPVTRCTSETVRIGPDAQERSPSEANINALPGDISLVNYRLCAASQPST